MFKLFKDLTRAPEPLNRPPVTPLPQPGSLHQPYTPRQRTRSPAPGQPTTSVSSENVTVRRDPNGKDQVVKESDVAETDEDALKVVELLKTLEDAGPAAQSVMIFVEVRILLPESKLKLTRPTDAISATFRPRPCPESPSLQTSSRLPDPDRSAAGRACLAITSKGSFRRRGSGCRGTADGGYTARL